MRNGKTIKGYDKNIPKSGKQVFEFMGEKLCHRSIKANKCDLLIHIESKAIIMAYPLGTDRSTVLDNISDNISLFEHFIKSRELYVVESPDDFKEDGNTIVVRDDTYKCYKKPSYSTSGSFGKKKYNITNERF